MKITPESILALIVFLILFFIAAIGLVGGIIVWRYVL